MTKINNLKVLIYILNFLLKEKSTLFVIFLFYQYLVIKKLQFKNIYPLDISLLKSILKNQNINDFKSTIVISKAKLKKLETYYKPFELGLLKYNSYYRIVLIRTINNLDNETILLSNELYFSWVKKESDVLANLYPLNFYPSIAQSVTVALIHNDDNIVSSITNSLLTNYFSKPKLLYIDDIFEIKLEDHIPDLLYLNSVYTKNKYFFKCLNISNNSYGICLKGTTELIQKADVQSYIPKCFYTLPKNINLKNIDKLIIDICPDGLKDYFFEIVECIRPFLNKNLSKNHLKLLKPAFLIKGVQGCGIDILLDSIIKYFGINLIQVESLELFGSTPTQTERKIKNQFLKLKFYSPCCIILNKFESLLKERDGSVDLRLVTFIKNEIDLLLCQNQYPIILICVSNKLELNALIERIFLQVFKIEPLTQNQREASIKWLCKQNNLDFNQINVAFISRRVNNYLFDDLKFLIREVLKNNKHNHLITTDSFNQIIDEMQKEYSDSIGSPEIAKVYWDDIGGLENIKNEIIKTINIPLEKQHLFRNNNLKRSGLLLYGPPGTGKTLIAKAVATECGLNFLSVKGPELLNMYVGQSESNVREIFSRAREASPCIIFFDELDSLAPNRGFSGDSGGVMDRLVSQLLSEMDGLDKTSIVFVIGATNRPDLIDPALLRPGRFDKLLYVGISNDISYKKNILKALTKKLKLNDEMLDEISSLLPNNVTGADIQSIVSNSWMNAARKQIISESKDNEIKLTVEDFRKSLENFKASVTLKDMQYYESLNKKF